MDIWVTNYRKFNIFICRPYIFLKTKQNKPKNLRASCMKRFLGFGHSSKAVTLNLFSNASPGLEIANTEAVNGYLELHPFTPWVTPEHSGEVP